MSTIIISDAGLGRRVPLSRRSAIRTGGLAALAAGLLGAARAEASPVTPASPLIVGTTTNVDDLVEEVREYIEASNAAWSAQESLKGDLVEMLGPKQQEAFDAFERARDEADWTTQEMYLAELARHLPGLAPALWGLWRHILDDGRGLGKCCLPETGDDA